MQLSKYCYGKFAIAPRNGWVGFEKVILVPVLTKPYYPKWIACQTHLNELPKPEMIQIVVVFCIAFNTILIFCSVFKWIIISMVKC